MIECKMHDEIMNDEVSLGSPTGRPETLDRAVFDAPGFIGRVADYTESVAYTPNRPLAFVGAVGAAAHFMGHGYRDAQGTSPNLMLAAIAPSGVGKEAPRETNRVLAAAVGKAGTVRENFASGPAIEDTLQAHPVTMYQVDELHTLMRQLAHGDKLAGQTGTMLLEFYSQANSLHTMRDKARQSDGTGLGDAIVSPRLTVIGTGTPRFYEAISESLLEDGLMGRFVVLEGAKLGDDNLGAHPRSLPSEVLGDLEAFVAADLAASSGEGYSPKVVPESAEATRLRQLALCQYTRLARAAEGTGEGVRMALWARAKDKTAKLALVFAASRDPKEPRIEAEDVRRAYAIVRHATQNLLSRASEYVHDTRFQADCQKVLRLIARKEGADGISYRDLSRLAPFKTTALKECLRKLADDEMIRMTEGPHGGAVFHTAA